MTEPPKYDPKDRKAPTGESLNKTARAIRERTPKSSAEITVSEGNDGVEFQLIKAGGFGGESFNPTRVPGTLPAWFTAEDLEPVLNAHYGTPGVEREWATVGTDLTAGGVQPEGYSLVSAACGVGLLAGFQVVLYEPSVGEIFVSMPSNDGLCATGKTAKVQVGDEWLNWLCTEADQALLECRVTVELAQSPSSQWQTHEASVPVPTELLGHCQPGTIHVVTAYGLGVIASAEVTGTTCKVIAAIPPDYRGRPAVTLRMSGVRQGMPEVWPRTVGQVAARNARHYWP